MSCVLHLFFVCIDPHDCRHTQTHASTHTHKGTYPRACTCTNIPSHVDDILYNMYRYVCMYVCTYACMYVARSRSESCVSFEQTFLLLLLLLLLVHCTSFEAGTNSSGASGSARQHSADHSAVFSVSTGLPPSKLVFTNFSEPIH